MKIRNVKKKGFTLVEIMIVVVIIGLLAALAIPAFNKVRQTSQRKTVLNNLRQLYAAAQQYFLENGVTTAAYSDLVGTQTGKWIKSVQPAAGEVYTGLTIADTAANVTISSASIGTVTYSP